MPVVDNPTWRHWPVLAHSLAHGKQRYGQFVLFRFDPVASVAVLDDAEASRAAALLPRDWFLGIAVRSAGDELRNAKGVPLLTLTIYVVGVGPTDPVSAAIPIFPATQLSDDHPAIQLDLELPWPDLYAHSFCAVGPVITRLHDGPDYFAACLTEEQLDAFVMLTVKDQYSRYDDVIAELEAAAQARRATECSQEKVSESSSVNGSGSDSQSHCGTGSLAASSDSADFMLCEEAQAITRIYYGRNDFAELWVGPAAECPGQPASLSACDDLRADLDKITKEWYDRKIGEAKARRSHMIAEWNQRVREAAAVDVDRPDAEDAHSVRGDESVAPEDAGDSRSERRASTTLSGSDSEIIETHKPGESAPGPSPTELQPASLGLNGSETAQHAPTAIAGVPLPSRDSQEGLVGKDSLRVLTERASSQTVEAQVQVGKDSKFAPPESWPQPAINGKVPAKSPSRNRLASLNRAAVKWFRSVIVRTKA